ncbi:MAG: hypothetical protein V4456_21940 [Bacteroidota bacterium]
MRKLIVILMLISGITLIIQCTNTPHSGKQLALKASLADEENCSADSLFPIRAPLNAEPDSGQECQFYQWAWASFLYITQDSLNKPRFLSYATPTELFSAGATPLFAKQSSRTNLLLAPRLEEDSVVTSFAEVEQATSKGVLIDKNGRAIYYAQHINNTFASFVKQHNLTNMDTLFAAKPDLEFVTGSLELKTSWKIVAPNEDVSSFYTTNADVAQFETRKDSSGKTIVVINPRKLKTERVALVGIHVVGVTKGHPEFIWATFEHDDLGPNNNNPNRSGETPSSDISGAINDKPLNPGNYLFYTNGLSAQKCNVATGIEDLIFQDEAKQTFKQTSNVFHQYWFDDDGLIESLNKNVRQKLGSSSVWSHYSLKGAVWLNSRKNFLENKNFAQMDKADTTVIGGEKALSNLTMETFTQANQRCFSCHKTKVEFDPNSSLSFPAKRISVSHVLTNAYFNIKRAGQMAMAKNKHATH